MQLKKGGTVPSFAQVLGIDRVSLWRKLKKHGLREDVPLRD
ncbi:MAG: hypothetical protein GXP46_00275 [Deferribacteres bacterium]|nr:hypothetical protein [Deferribacteres bacterium]